MNARTMKACPSSGSARIAFHRERLPLSATHSDDKRNIFLSGLFTVKTSSPSSAFMRENNARLKVS